MFALVIDEVYKCTEHHVTCNYSQKTHFCPILVPYYLSHTTCPTRVPYYFQFWCKILQSVMFIISVLKITFIVPYQLHKVIYCQMFALQLLPILVFKKLHPIDCPVFALQLLTILVFKTLYPIDCPIFAICQFWCLKNYTLLIVPY